MHQNIHWIRIKFAGYEFVQHIGGLSPTICRLFLLSLKVRPNGNRWSKTDLLTGIWMWRVDFHLVRNTRPTLPFPYHVMHTRDKLHMHQMSIEIIIIFGWFRPPGSTWVSVCRLFKRTANAFSLNAIVDVRRRRRRRHEMIFFISRKLLELATSKFTTM